MLKSPTSRWSAGAAGLCIALLVLTYLVLVAPRRADADALTEQTAAAEQANDTTQLRTAQLRALYATLPQRRQELTSMLAQLPVTADVPGFVRSLDSMARTSGVTLTGVTPAQGGYVPVGGAGGTAAAPGTGSDGGGADGTVRAVQVPVSVVVKGPYFKAVTFLQRLQSAQRAFLVAGLQVTVSGSDVTLTVKGDIFALPGAAEALKAASPDAKAAQAPAAALPAGGASGAAAGAASGGSSSTPTTAPQGASGRPPAATYPAMTSPPTSPPHVAVSPAAAGATSR